MSQNMGILSADFEVAAKAVPGYASQCTTNGGEVTNMQQVDKETILAYAEKYKQIGLNIIPIKYGQKTPLRKWQEFQHRKLSQSEFEATFGSGEAVNIGVVCGEISGNLVSLDFDDPHNFHRFFLNMRKLQEETPIIQSSRGRHVWIRTARPVKSFSIPQLCLDVLGEGKIAIAPPSVHPDGTIYSFLNPKIIEPMHVSDFQKAIVERCRTLHAKIPSTLTTPNSNGFRLNAGKTETRMVTQAEKDRIVSDVAPFWIRGHRNSMCMYLLGWWIKAGVSQTAATELITRICDLTGDEEKRERLWLVNYHYGKPASSIPKLKGLSGIKEILDA